MLHTNYIYQINQNCVNKDIFNFITMLYFLPDSHPNLSSNISQQFQFYLHVSSWPRPVWRRWVRQCAGCPEVPHSWMGGGDETTERGDDARQVKLMSFKEKQQIKKVNRHGQRTEKAAI
jgi:hypothetical protein